MSDKPPRILIVDDDEATAMAVRGVLYHQLKAEVQWASCLAEAREALYRGRFDTILLDLMLTDGGGEDMLEYLNGRPDRPRVVVVTGVPPGTARWNKVEAMGPDLILNKPWELEDLLAAAQGDPQPSPQPKG